MEDSRDDTTKYLIQRLRMEPFQKDFNLASFDSMNREEILQIFNDVLSTLDANQHTQIIHEDPTDTTERMTKFLRVLKYKPLIEDPMKFQEGIMAGSSDIICPIMAWILEKQETLSTRAYLANFLVEIDIPTEYLEDEDIAETRLKHLNLMEDFKSIHKEFEKLKGGFNISELMGDMQNIEHDLDCIRRRIEIARSKFGNQSDLEPVLTQARLNRKAREKIHELCKQAQFEEQKLHETEALIRSHKRTLKDLKERNGGLTSGGILEALEENCEIMKYIVLEKLPKDMECNERFITAMKLVENDPPTSQKELNDLKLKAQLIKTELHTLASRMMKKMHDKELLHLREQASHLESIRRLKLNKLESISRSLDHKKEALSTLSREKAHSFGLEPWQGDVNLTGSGPASTEGHYRQFMKQMRIKAGKYKQLRLQLSQLQHEAGILASTKFILNGELMESTSLLDEVEAKFGIQGYCAAQDQLEEFSAKKSVLNDSIRTSLYEMSCMSKELNDKLALKKLDLEPLVKDLQAKRLQTELLQRDHMKLKDQYDSAMTAVELDQCHYQAKLGQLANQNSKFQLELEMLRHEISIMKTDMQRVQEEAKAEQTFYAKEKTRSFKDKLLIRILEEERRSAQLKEENNHIEETCAQRRCLYQEWSDLQKLLQLKMDTCRNDYQD